MAVVLHDNRADPLVWRRLKYDADEGRISIMCVFDKLYNSRLGTAYQAITDRSNQPRSWVECKSVLSQ
jgi:hypothetical protein